MWQTVLVIAIIALILGGAIFYIVKAKKSGKKCIGCPYSDECSKTAKKGENSVCSCGCQEDNK
ncbi:MAG: FeoB-associated Cys-rich membrane protein [Clostridia bacterium]|nr:FeoB-associated Cys-rich membrane protein [Clostridia bacterium]